MPAGDGVILSCPALQGDMPQESVTLFQKLGGHAAIAAAVDIFYNRILADPELAPFFEGTDMQTQRIKQQGFMTFVFGGAQDYTGRDLHTAHKRLIAEKGLNETHFGMVAGHLAATLRELNVPEVLVGEVLAVVSTAKPLIFGAGPSS